MRVFSLFELFLVIFAFYAILKYEGSMRILVPIFCLVAVFLFERLRRRSREVERADKRLLKHDSIQFEEYSVEGNDKPSQPARWDE